MIKKRMLPLLTFAVAIYILLIAYMYVSQRQMLYFPDKNLLSPSEYGLSGFEEIRVTSTDGTRVQLWYRPAQEGFPTVVYYHGNASHLGNRAGILDALADQGFGVLGLSYRGYGQSEGSPTEQGIYHDARAAINYLIESHNIQPGRIFLYGESLGTGVAVQMATEYQVAGIILQAAYTSVAARAAEIYFYIPVQMLIKDRFDSIHKIARVQAPLLLFHGELDNVIPIKQGRSLFDAAISTKKSFYLPGISHNDFDSGMISAHVLEFAKEHQLITQ